jgi:hypothetical protein
MDLAKQRERDNQQVKEEKMVSSVVLMSCMDSVQVVLLRVVGLT